MKNSQPRSHNDPQSLNDNLDNQEGKEEFGSNNHDNDNIDSIPIKKCSFLFMMEKLLNLMMKKDYFLDKYPPISTEKTFRSASPNLIQLKM